MSQPEYNYQQCLKDIAFLRTCYNPSPVLAVRTIQAGNNYELLLRHCQVLEEQLEELRSWDVPNGE